MGVCEEHVRYRPGGLRLRPPPTPRGGDCCRGNARLPKAAEMRLKMSRSDAGGSAASGGGGCSAGVGGWSGGSRGASSAPPDPVEAEAAAGTEPGPSSLTAGGGGGSATPLPTRGGSTLLEPSRLARRRLGIWRFLSLGSLAANAEEGRVPSVLGGAVHRHAARGPGKRGGPAPARRTMRPPHACWASDNAAPPCASGLRDEYSAPRRGPGRDSRTAWARRGAGVAVVACPATAANAPAQASAPCATQRPMLRAERVLCATARLRRAAEPRGRERDATGRRLRGPPGIWEHSPPPPPRGDVGNIPSRSGRQVVTACGRALAGARFMSPGSASPGS